MRTIGNFQFPSEEREEWSPLITYRCLHRHCMIVARTRVEGRWKAYCGPVAGMDHDREALDEDNGPLHDGDPVPENIARALFPDFDELPYAK